jgi:hypothetical protein
MQPAQLSLLATPDHAPAPPVLAELAQDDVGEAIRILAKLIAKASQIRPANTTSAEEAGPDE